MKRNIAIITARGGSKRLPRKNIKEFRGLPLLVHSINYAKQNLHIIDEIVVTTDDEEIKRIALSHDVKVVERPSAISGDSSTSLEAIQHVIETIGDNFENIVLLQPSNPLRPVNLLEEAYRKVNSSDSDSLFTVLSILEKLGRIKNDRFEPFNYSYGDRSQDIEPFYRENGLLYITRLKLLKKNLLLSPNAIPFIVDHPFAEVDIDTENDFRFAEFIFEKFK